MKAEKDDSGKIVLEHYSKEETVREILEYCRGRWCAFLVKAGEGFKIVRYDRMKPITLNSVDEFKGYLKAYNMRTVYGTVHFYRRMEKIEDVKDVGNIFSSEPVWDIDNTVEDWRRTVEAAKIIYEFLEEKGVKRSVFIKWSGEGVHVHLNRNAISEEVYRRIHPLDAAYAVVEYVRGRVGEKILNLGGERLKVENKIDPQRLFTSPLTFHRKLNLVTVCINPDRLDDFTIEDASPQEYVHYREWKRFTRGEADQLVFEAYDSVGPYPGTYIPRKRRRRLEDEIRKWQRYEVL